MEWQAAEGPAGRNKAYVNLSRGWVFGSREFKGALVVDQKVQAFSRAWEIGGAREVNALRWGAMLSAALTVVRKIAADLVAAPKSAPWKLAIATWLKATAQADNRWLAHSLNPGVPAAASHNVSRYRKTFRDRDPLWWRLRSISAA